MRTLLAALIAIGVVLVLSGFGVRPGWQASIGIGFLCGVTAIVGWPYDR